ncbi:LOW QUALITY PROTEIN: late histone H1 [Drosophila ficusphila]|uniref:LOW QUALITY PROTEIN: late histone H1 n=1 Tax=Drosophila ficusphila TaxID=30025 RepID=UPI001C8A62FE|nr:LOW QUALITY PROTEIN: late histone H1 [Drosophila ficusphila]
MKLKIVDHNDSSDDEGEEEMQYDNDESEQSNVGEEDEELEEEEEEHPEEEEPDADNQGAARVPYPTPPPDDGSKMGPPDSGKGDLKPKSESKGSLISLALMAIGELKSRSGSSVRAIMAYLKDKGHEWKFPKKTARLMHRALKLAETNGEVEMTKRSFKLTKKYKDSSKAVEKMKAKQLKEKAKKKKEEQVLKEKSEKKEKKEKEKSKLKAKKEKPSKPTERKTKQVSLSKKGEDEHKDSELLNKTAAAAAAGALLETPKSVGSKKAKKPAKPNDKSKAATSKVGSSSKKPRKSIGTLAQPTMAKPKVKAVKKLVAGKGITHFPDISSTDISAAQATSTPQGPTREKRKRKV